MKRHETLVVEIEGNSQKWASLQVGRRVPREFGELSYMVCPAMACIWRGYIFIKYVKVVDHLSIDATMSTMLPDASVGPT